MIPALPALRILLVDDSPLVRQGIRAVLERVSEGTSFSISGEAGSVHQAIEYARQLKPDVVLLDLRLPDGFGYSACREILRQNPATKVLILTSSLEDEHLYQAISAGAQGYILKDIEPNGLIDAVRRIGDGESIIAPDLVTRVLKIIQARSQPGSIFTLLSPQEKRVMDLVAQGKTNKEIGEKLGLSENTVKNYLSNAFEKLKVKRRSEATAIYLRLGKVSPTPNRA